jgi:hypothetical protein
MRSRRKLHSSRVIPIAGGALMLAAPTAAVLASTAGSADAQSAIPVELSTHHVGYGSAIVVSGGTLSTAGHTPLSLQFAPAGGTSWRTLATTTASRTGSYRFAVKAARSGLLRVVPVGAATADATSARSAGSPGAPSAAQRLTVGSRFTVPTRALTVIGGRRAAVHGALSPAAGGRRIVLEARSGHGWRRVTSTRTNRRGGFRLATGALAGGRRTLRVAFAGDRQNTGSTARAGSIAAATPDVASWYDDGGATACGFHATYGVANRTLPCGTKVTFTRGGRSVTATVDDRGPFVGGRNWDLNQNTAGALGFDGVGTVWVSS